MHCMKKLTIRGEDLSASSLLIIGNKAKHKHKTRMNKIGITSEKYICLNVLFHAKYTTNVNIFCAVK